MINRIKEWVNNNSNTILKTYQFLHENGEVSWQEHKTTDYLCEQLRMLDIPYETFDNHTGVIGYWGNKELGQVVGIRSDIDALWQLVDGEWKANHSCGHDAHMSIVLHTIRCLMEIGFSPNGLIKIIFQPAEESGKGAKAIIDTGKLDDIEYLLGIHLRPIQELRFGQASPAIYHGATTLLKGKIFGISAHGARPNLGINVIDSLGAIISAINAIKMDPTVSASVKVTSAKAGGENYNIIPDYAEFGIDVRAQENNVMEELLKKINQAVFSAGTSNMATIELETVASMVAAIASREIENIVKNSIIEALGEKNLMPPAVTPGGEDFHFYKTAFPKIQATMVGLGTDLSPGLHHPQMNFNLNSLGDGVTILSNSIFKLFEINRT